VAALYTSNQKIIKIKKILFKSKKSNLNKKNQIFDFKKIMIFINPAAEMIRPYSRVTRIH